MSARDRTPMFESKPFVMRAVQVGFLGLLLGLWFIATSVTQVHRLLLPGPPQVWHEMQRLVVTGELWRAARVTLLTVGQAYGIAVASGLLIGFCVSRSRHAVRLLEPVLSGFFAIPLTLFFPLFILFFGIGTASKLAYGALYALLPTALASIAAFARIDPLLIRAATAMGARPAALLHRVYLPAALPGVLSGMRIALVICIAAVLGGETLASTAGVGYAIKVAEELMEVARMYAWLIFVILASFALNMLLSVAERWSVES